MNTAAPPLSPSVALHGIDMSLPAGRCTSVVGPNGAGKSTLLKALAGLLPPAGSVDLLGEPLAGLSKRQRARQMSWLGQNENGTDDLTAYDVAMLGRRPHQPWLAAPSPLDRAAVEQALRSTQAWQWRERPLGQLSGGERQRVLLARALAVQAQVLLMLMLMDEPLADLEPPHQADWLVLVRAMVAAGRTVVSVLHEISLALQADEMVVMNAGQVVFQGACVEPATRRALEEVFERRIAVHSVAGQWVTLPNSSNYLQSNPLEFPYANRDTAIGQAL